MLGKLVTATDPDVEELLSTHDPASEIFDAQNVSLGTPFETALIDREGELLLIRLSNDVDRVTAR